MPGRQEVQGRLIEVLLQQRVRMKPWSDNVHPYVSRSVLITWKGRSAKIEK